jgi:hypothetical protein
MNQTVIDTIDLIFEVAGKGFRQSFLFFVRRQRFLLSAPTVQAKHTCFDVFAELTTIMRCNQNKKQGFEGIFAKKISRGFDLCSAIAAGRHSVYRSAIRFNGTIPAFKPVFRYQSAG